MRQRFRIVNRKARKDRSLSGFLRFCPSRFSGFSSASAALLVAHRLKTTLAADLAALRAHFAHDLLDDGQFSSLGGFDGFQENAPGILNRIKRFGRASPLWHSPSVARMAGFRQDGRISNRPTTEMRSEERRVGKEC